MIERWPPDDPSDSTAFEVGTPSAGDPLLRPLDPSTLELPGEGDAAAEAVARINRLGLTVRGLGLASLGMGVGSAAFIWPSVRLRGLALTVGLALAFGVAGLAVRLRHRRALGRLPRQKARPTILRTKVHRCQVGLALGVLMLAMGVAIRLAERAAGGSEAEAAIRPDVARGFARLRAEALRPGQERAGGPLTLGIAWARVVADDDGPGLVVRLRGRNASPSLKVDLRPFDDVESPLAGCVLQDDLGNRYSLREPPRSELEWVPGLEPTAAIDPGESTGASLSFEPPVEAARTLLLWVPAGTFKLNGPAAFEIDAASLLRADAASESL